MGTSVFLSVYYAHVAVKDVVIHEKHNAINSYAILRIMSELINPGEIPKIYTPLLEYVNIYSKPIYDKYYANSNVFYNLSDDLRVLDNISFMLAMNELGYDIIEIDGQLYSKTGKVTEIIYTENGENKMYYTSRIFEDNEEIVRFLSNTSSNLTYNREISSVISNVYDSKTLEEIPTIKKNKEDGTITIDEPINETITNFAMKLLK